MQLANIPAYKTPIIWAKNASSNYKRVVPTGSQSGGAASFGDGFVPANFTPVQAGGVPPFGQDMNGVLNQMTSWDQWYQAGGTIQYDPAFQAAGGIGGYPARARVESRKTPFLMWYSTAENNMTDPDATTGASASSGWQTAVFPDPNTQIDPANPTAKIPPPGGLTVTAAPGVLSNGASIQMIGNTANQVGAVASPKKWMRVFNGNWALINDGNNKEILTVDDVGNITNVNAITVAGQVKAGSASITNDVAAATAHISGNATIGGAASADSLQIGTTTNPQSSGYAYFQKGVESGGTMKADSFCQFAGPVHLGGVDSSLYFTDSPNVNWTGARGFIHRKFSGSQNQNTYGTDKITIGVWNLNGTTLDNTTNVVTIDTNGGMTAAGEVAIADQIDTQRGYVMGIVNNATKARYISFTEPRGTQQIPWQLRFERYDTHGSKQDLFGLFSGDEGTVTVGGITITASVPLFTVDNVGNGFFNGRVSALNVTTMADAIEALTERLAALEARV